MVTASMRLPSTRLFAKSQTSKQDHQLPLLSQIGFQLQLSPFAPALEVILEVDRQHLSSSLVYKFVVSVDRLRNSLNAVGGIAGALPPERSAFIVDRHFEAIVGVTETPTCVLHAFPNDVLVAGVWISKTKREVSGPAEMCHSNHLSVLVDSLMQDKIWRRGKLGERREVDDILVLIANLQIQSIRVAEAICLEDWRGPAIGVFGSMLRAFCR